MGYRVLTVCSGNTCRSPATDLLLRNRLDDSVHVSSAGTRGLDGWPVSTPMAQLLATDGISATGYRARMLNPRIAREAELVITLAEQHRPAVLNASRLTTRRVVVLGELARLAREVPREHIVGDDDATRLRSLVESATALRYLEEEPHFDDVADPWDFGNADYEGAYAQIKEHVETIVDALR